MPAAQRHRDRRLAPRLSAPRLGGLRFAARRAAKELDQRRAAALAAFQALADEPTAQKMDHAGYHEIFAHLAAELTAAKDTWATPVMESDPPNYKGHMPAEPQREWLPRRRFPAPGVGNLARGSP